MEEKKLFSQIQNLISNQNFKDAKNLAEKIKDDIEKENVLGIISYYEKNLEESIKHFEKSLKVNPIHSDALFNYSKVLFEMENYFESWRYLTRIHEKNWQVFDLLGDTQLKQDNPAMALYYYKKAAELSNIPEMNEKYKVFKNKFKKDVNLAIFCLPGLDNFIKDIAEILSNIYNVILVVSTDRRQIQEAYNWADIVWLEWANEMAIEITNKFPKMNKNIICRLHSYEALLDFPEKINWNNVDTLILVSRHIEDILKNYHSEIYSKHIKNKITIIPNGVNLNKFKFSIKKPGFDLAVVANINHKKAPEMWLQVIHLLKKTDERYTLHIAGKFQDIRYANYFNYFIKDSGLEKNVKLYGYINDMNEFLENKNYILSTSIHEGHPYNILEAMASGIKPLIHNYSGSKKQWPNELIFNFIYEIVEKVQKNYNSENYRKFIEDKYSLEIMVNKITKTINSLNIKKSNINNINILEFAHKDPDDFKNNEYILNYLLSKNNIKSYIEFIEYLLINGKLELKQKIDYFIRNLYYKLDNYQRFEYLSEKPFKYLEKEGEFYLNKYYNKYFSKENKNNKKIHFLFILNGLDYFQILFRFVFESIINSQNKNIEYHVLSLLDENSFNNAEYAKNILKKHNIDFFIPKVSNTMEDLIIQYYDYISKVKPDVSFYHSMYLAPYGILIYPLLRKVSKLLGRQITQDIEPYFDNKLDFVYTGIKDKIPTKNVFLKLPPVNSELINKNKNIKKDYYIPQKNKVVISIGRSIKYYNDNYWMVIKKLADEIENLTFVFFGPNYEGYFKEIIPEKYVTNKKILLLGPNLNARAYLKSCDFYINSAPNGGGISFNEAYYANLPIITFVKEYDYSKKNIENRVNTLPIMFYEDALQIFPKLGDYNGLYKFAKKIILDENFKNLIQSKRKIDNKELEYKTFVKEFEEFVIKLLKSKGRV